MYQQIICANTKYLVVIFLYSTKLYLIQHLRVFIVLGTEELIVCDQRCVFKSCVLSLCEIKDAK